MFLHSAMHEFDYTQSMPECKNDGVNMCMESDGMCVEIRV